jgi:hypothetical protein
MRAPPGFLTVSGEEALIMWRIGSGVCMAFLAYGAWTVFAELLRSAWADAKSFNVREEQSDPVGEDVDERPANAGT